MHREFVYIGADQPEINEEKYEIFLLTFQKALFASLRERRLLNYLQYEQCIKKLEKQYKREE